ncbi:MAG: hypothetical protein ACRDJJ_00530 [Actinomycetota bacterium]
MAPPPPPPPLVAPSPGPVKLVLEDGSVHDLSADADVRRRVAYLVDNLLPTGHRRMRTRHGKPVVRLVFSDGSTRELPEDPEVRRRLSYLVESLLAGQAGSLGRARRV